MFGGIVSILVILCTWLMEFPQESLDTHILKMVSIAGQIPGTIESLLFKSTFTVQLSIPAMAMPSAKAEVSTLQLTIVSAGKMAMSGGILSTTLNNCVHVSLLAASLKLPS